VVIAVEEDQCEDLQVEVHEDSKVTAEEEAHFVEEDHLAGLTLGLGRDLDPLLVEKEAFLVQVILQLEVLLQ